MLFVITGCLADAQRATVLVEEFAKGKLAMDLATVSVGTELVASEQAPDDRGTALGLLLIVGGVAQPPILTLDPSGTVVGALATGPGAITNVAADVSRGGRAYSVCPLWRMRLSVSSSSKSAVRMSK